MAQAPSTYLLISSNRIQKILSEAKLCCDENRPPICMRMSSSLKTRFEPKVINLLLHSKTVWCGFTTLIVSGFKPRAGSVCYSN